MRWVAQINLSAQYSSDLESACATLGYNFIPVKVIPFSEEIPDVDTNDVTVFYGATNWINSVYMNNIWNPGVFFNPESIFSLWDKNYGERSLNSGAHICTLNGWSRAVKDGDLWKCDPDELHFVRPTSDNKEFAGQVLSNMDIVNWKQKLTGDLESFGEIPIVLSTPYTLRAEWRCFVINGECNHISYYRKEGRPFRQICNLKNNTNIFKRIKTFSENMAEQYSPEKVFVMDICETGNELYIVEIGCFNSAGFYDVNLELLIKEVSEAAMEQ